MRGRQNSIIRLPAGRPRSRQRPDRASARPPTGGKDRLPRYLTQDELGRFRRAVVVAGRSRDVALFGLMYRFGLRASEATLLLLEDLDLSRSRIRIRRAKGGDAKEYPLPRDLVPAIRRYLRKREDKGSFLFTGRESNNQHGLRVLAVQRWFKKYAADAHLSPAIASHSLRHSIAVHSLEEGFGLEYVADLLGHTSIRSTAIYAKVTTPAREEMMRRLDRSRHVVSWS
ncbi:MAG: tyrosine-type recombinase/integrase [Candidatus Eisenbacteria bacterium]|uniref:Tyrosine-type recombinase/integrase n=1 Tax=Eiseniibacteriota bacterium TaxID=2212470 RepID=A0A849SEY2_UNCEI|nr:tyrosine-type recombinase/integrase [Candidatus Eisenbacteria bacterium]